jgi:hypothetical protein
LSSSRWSFKIFSQINGENRFAVFGIAIQVIGATIGVAVLSYVPMVLFYFFTGHATGDRKNFLATILQYSELFSRRTLVPEGLYERSQAVYCLE